MKFSIIRSHNRLWLLPSLTGSKARLRGMNFFSWLDFRVFIFLLGRIRKQNKLKAKDAAVANISSLCVKKVTASFKILEEGFM